MIRDFFGLTGLAVAIRNCEEYFSEFEDEMHEVIKEINGPSWKPYSKKINIDEILIFFLISHFLIWVVVPTISNNNLPLDVIEAIVWSDGWPLGWDKHPPLSSWFPGFFFQIFGNQDWAFYFLSQIFITCLLYTSDAADE